MMDNNTLLMILCAVLGFSDLILSRGLIVPFPAMVRRVLFVGGIALLLFAAALLTRLIRIF